MLFWLLMLIGALAVLWDYDDKKREARHREIMARSRALNGGRPTEEDLKYEEQKEVKKRHKLLWDDERRQYDMAMREKMERKKRKVAR